MSDLINIVHNADCIEAMKQYADKYFDLAVVDPPYGINAPNMTMGSNPNRKGRDKRGEIQYGSTSVAQKLLKGRLNGGGGKLKNRNLNTMNCDWDYEKPSKEYFEQLFRISKNQIIWGGIILTYPQLEDLLFGIKINLGIIFLRQNLAGLLLIALPKYSHFLTEGEPMKKRKYILLKNLLNYMISAFVILLQKE